MSVVFGERSPRVTDIVRVIRAEYDEMPGMCLTEWQIRRLWNLASTECLEALDYLCETGILVRDPAGRYLRRRLRY
jgi:hypothetical protein